MLRQLHTIKTISSVECVLIGWVFNYISCRSTSPLVLALTVTSIDKSYLYSRTHARTIQVVEVLNYMFTLKQFEISTLNQRSKLYRWKITEHTRL